MYAKLVIGSQPCFLMEKGEPLGFQNCHLHACCYNSLYSTFEQANI